MAMVYRIIEANPNPPRKGYRSSCAVIRHKDAHGDEREDLARKVQLSTSPSAMNGPAEKFFRGVMDQCNRRLSGLIIARCHTMIDSHITDTNEPGRAGRLTSSTSRSLYNHHASNSHAHRANFHLCEAAGRHCVRARSDCGRDALLELLRFSSDPVP